MEWICHFGVVWVIVLESCASFLPSKTKAYCTLRAIFFVLWTSYKQLLAILIDWSGTYFGADIIRQLFENRGIKRGVSSRLDKRLLTSSRGTLEFNCHVMIPKVQSSLAVTAWVFWLYAYVADIIKFDECDSNSSKCASCSLFCYFITAKIHLFSCRFFLYILSQNN